MQASSGVARLPPSGCASRHRRPDTSLLVRVVRYVPYWREQAAPTGAKSVFTTAVRNEDSDGAILSRRDEQLAVAGLADEEIGAGDLGAHFPIDQLLQRHIHPVAAGVPLVELHFLDRRHGAGDAVVGLLHRGKVGRKDAAALNVAKDILAAQRGDPAVIRKPAGYRRPFVVVVDRDRIGEAVLYAPIQDFLRQRVELVERAAAPATVFPIALARHPAVVPAVADDVDLLDLVHADVIGEHGPVGVP